MPYRVNEENNTYYIIMEEGFVKVAAVVPSVNVGHIARNVSEICKHMSEAWAAGVEIVVFPELSLTGYSCGDLFGQATLLAAAERGLRIIAETAANKSLDAVVGLPLPVDGVLFNVAAVVQGGHIMGIVPKSYLPNYNEFYEQRWFASALGEPCRDIQLCGQTVRFGATQIFRTPSATFGIELCEDLWSAVPPSSRLSLAGAEIILNLSATNELTGKHDYLCQLLAQQSARTLTAYIYSSCGFGESSTDVVFGGNAMVYENGTLLAEGQRFSISPQLVVADVDIERLRHDRRTNTTFAACRHAENSVMEIRTLLPTPTEHTVLQRTFNPLPFVPHDDDREHTCSEIFNIQCMGLARRLDHTHARTAVVGISGGLDSTLALLVTVRAFDSLGRQRSDIIGITMPGFGTTDRTHDNAVRLMQSLGITIREISIAQAVTLHFSDIGHDSTVHGVAYEDSQASGRTQILMDVANQTGGLVIGTGDLSELALGWATYNGDHMSMYGVNASIPKTLVRHLVAWVADHTDDATTRNTLLDVIDTPVSPELLPADEQGNIAQKTEDLVGPYELHDFFLYYALRYGMRPRRIHLMALRAFGGAYDEATVRHWLTTFYRRFFAQQFKRSCMPDGPKVGSVALSPRGDWRMPSDATAAEWLEELKTL